MGDEQVQLSALPDVHGGYAHAGPGHAHGVDSAAADHGFVFKFSGALVYPKLVGHAVVRHVNVNSAVIVKIRANDTESVAIGFVQSCGEGDVFKRAVAPIVIQGRHGRGVVVQRRAIVSQTSSRKAVQLRLLRPLQVVHDDQIQGTISIVIEKGGAGAPGVAFDASLFRDIGESAVAVVSVKSVSTEVGHINVDPSIAVVIAAGASHAVFAMTANAGPLSDVTE